MAVQVAKYVQSTVTTVASKFFRNFSKFWTKEKLTDSLYRHES